MTLIQSDAAREMLRFRQQPLGRGLAAEILRIAVATHDRIAAGDLQHVAARVLRMERALDEIVQNALDELRLAPAEERAS